MWIVRYVSILAARPGRVIGGHRVLWITSKNDVEKETATKPYRNVSGFRKCLRLDYTGFTVTIIIVLGNFHWPFTIRLRLYNAGRDIYMSVSIKCKEL